MATKDLIRGHLRRAKTAINNTLYVGDSIGNPYTGSFGNMTSKMISRFSTANTRFVGQASGWAAHGVSTNGLYGNDVSGTGITSGNNGGGVGSLFRPGEAWPNTLETKTFVRTTKTYYCSGNVTDTTPLLFQCNDFPRGPADQAWSSNTTLSFTLSVRSSPNSPNTWTFQPFTGTGGTSGTPVSLSGISAAAAYQIYQKASFTTNTHTSVGTLCAIRPGVETENGTTKRDLCFLSFGIRNTTRTTGTFWGYCGYGSWKPANHASEDGAVITTDPPTYIGAYSDAALAQDYAAFQWNHVLLWISANPDDANDLIGSAQRFRTQLLRIITRHRQAANVSGLTPPKFTLVSQYFTSSSALTLRYFEMCRDIAYDIALRDRSCEFIDLFGHILDTYATYAAWNTAGLADAVHPSTAGANILSDRIETVGFGSDTEAPPPMGTSSVPVAAGPASRSKLAAIGKSRIYRSAA